MLTLLRGIMGEIRTRPTARKIWDRFTKKGKRKCAESDYDCLRHGGYWITLDGDKKSYKCGCGEE